MEKISVLMPVYKTPLDWLDESIESILNQTYKNFDFIIVNDCAPEEETCRLREWARQDSRIILIEHQKNLGCAEALNTGLKACKTRLVARMDSDDYSLPNRLEKQVMFFEENPEVDILGTGYHSYQKKSVTHPLVSNEACVFSTLMCCSVAHPTIMYKRDTVMRLGMYDKRVIYAEDYDLWARAVKGGCVFANLDEDLLAYRTKTFDGNEAYFTTQRIWAKKVSTELIVSMAKLHDIDLRGYPENLGTYAGAVNLMRILDLLYNKVFSEKGRELKEVRKRNLREAYKTYEGPTVCKLALKCYYKLILAGLRF